MAIERRYNRRPNGQFGLGSNAAAGRRNRGSRIAESLRRTIRRLQAQIKVLEAKNEPVPIEIERLLVRANKELAKFKPKSKPAMTVTDYAAQKAGRRVVESSPIRSNGSDVQKSPPSGTRTGEAV